MHTQKTKPWVRGITYSRQTPVPKKTIWHQKQNYPELVVDDFWEMFEYQMRGLGADDDAMKLLKEGFYNAGYGILLKRGINKWLMNRILLIRYKKELGTEMKWLSVQLRLQKLAMTEQYGKNWKLYNSIKNEFLMNRGRLKALTAVRTHLRTICMSPRYVIWNYKDPMYISLVGLPNKWKRRFLGLTKDLNLFRQQPTYDIEHLPREHQVDRNTGYNKV